MNGHIREAARMGFVEQLRRPLVLVMLVVVPLVFITRSIAQTTRAPRQIVAPGGFDVLTDMQALHGASMAAITIAFMTGLIAAFVMNSSRMADRRLVIAGFRPREIVISRMLVLAAATVLVVLVSLVVIAFDFTPRSWPLFIAGNAMIGVVYGLIGALAGRLMGLLGATYFMLFAAMLDIGIVQNPMFVTGDPEGFARLLPGYGPNRITIDGALAPDASFHSWTALAAGGVWLAALSALVLFAVARNAATE